jgi:hypothetical protein
MEFWQFDFGWTPTEGNLVEVHRKNIYEVEVKTLQNFFHYASCIGNDMPVS